MATHNPKFDEKVKFVINDAVLIYAKLWEDYLDTYVDKKTKAEKKSYKVTCGVTPELGEKMADSGFNVKQDEEGNYWVDAKRNYQLTDGKLMDPPRIEFEDGTLYNKETDGLIGNGSTADVHVTAQYMKIGKVTHLPMYLFKIVLKNFIPYKQEDGESADSVF